MPKTNALTRRVAKRSLAAEHVITAMRERLSKRIDEILLTAFDKSQKIVNNQFPFSSYNKLQYHFRLAYRDIYEEMTNAFHDIAFKANRRAMTSVVNAMTKQQLRSIQQQIPVKESIYDDIMAWLFDPLSIDDVSQIVFSTSSDVAWYERLFQATKLATPEALAQEIIQSTAAGETYKDLERRLLPVVNGVRSSARRIARTEAVRIGHETQFQAWDAIGDMVIGYQVHATPNPPNRDSRPWHQSRSGTIYYKNPEAGQKGLDQMPRPPLEARDPSERPAGTPEVAWNCLCYLTPVLKPN